MEIESCAVETDDPDEPILARITIGTRKNKHVMHEWPAASLAQAQSEADAWLDEYSARLGLGDPALSAPSAIAHRAGIIHDAMPALPEPKDEYVARSLVQSCAAPARNAADRVLQKRGRGYAPQSIIKRVVSAASDAGIAVTGVRVWPDGSVAVFSGIIDQDLAEDLTFAD